MGDGAEAGTEIGPLINAPALEKVERLVERALTAGAKTMLGGTRSDVGELFYTPTVISAVEPEMDIAKEEIFGPVAALIDFDSEDDVIRMANDTPYGLAAYVYTRDIGRAWRMSDALDYGMVAINDAALSNAAAPFGGVKQSGMGRQRTGAIGRPLSDRYCAHAHRAHRSPDGHRGRFYPAL